jgi:hypothetical protein
LLVTHRSHRVVLGRPLERPGEVERERPVDGVQHERPVEDDPGEAVVRLIEHVVLGRGRDLVAFGRVALARVALGLGDGYRLVAHRSLLVRGSSLPVMLSRPSGAGERRGDVTAP